MCPAADNVSETRPLGVAWRRLRSGFPPAGGERRQEDGQARPASARRRGIMARGFPGRPRAPAPCSPRRKLGWWPAGRAPASMGGEIMCMRLGRAVILVLSLCLPGAADVTANGAADPGLPQFSPTTPPRPAPEVTVQTRSGETVRLADFKGRPVLINSLGHLVRALRCRNAGTRGARGRARRHAIGDHGGVRGPVKGESVVAPFIRKLGLSKLPIYLDPETKALRAFESDALPTTVLIDRRGREVGRLLGAASWDGAAARHLIDRLLSPNPPDAPGRATLECSCRKLFRSSSAISAVGRGF